MNLDIVLFLLLASIISLNIVIPKPYVEINMVDVGQGDSISIKTTHGRNILIDGGGSEQSSYDVGEKVLVPYLLDNSNGVIDVMVVSHFHEDHAEGLITVLNTLKVKKIVIGLQPSNSNLYNELLRISTEKNIPVICLYQGSSFTVDDVNFEIVYPKKQIEIQDDLNNNSLVLLCKVYGKSLLLTGDAENIEEDMFIENINQRVDILKVGHHGSRTSTTQTLLERIRPKVFLISAGVDNKFGHPHEEVLNRIEKYSEHIYRTDLQGEITLRIYKNSKMSIKTKL
jgi:competence protein ComEC